MNAGCTSPRPPACPPRACRSEHCWHHSSSRFKLKASPCYPATASFTNALITLINQRACADRATTLYPAARTPHPGVPRLRFLPITAEGRRFTCHLHIIYIRRANADAAPTKGLAFIHRDCCIFTKKIHFKFSRVRSSRGTETSKGKYDHTYDTYRITLLSV